MTDVYVPGPLREALDEQVASIIALIKGHTDLMENSFFVAAPLYYVVDELAHRLVEDGVFVSESVVEGTLHRVLRNLAF